MTEEGEELETGKSYLQAMEYNLKLMEDAKPKDRLEYAKELLRCIQILTLSVKGWRAWLGNYDVIDNITLEEFQEVFPKMRQLITDFVKLDLELTKKKFAESEKKTPPKTSKKEKYIS